MNRQAVLEQLLSIVADKLEHELPPQVTESSRLFEDVGIDSIMILQLIVYVEETFGVTVPDENVDAGSFETVGGLITFIQELQSAQVGP